MAYTIGVTGKGGSGKTTIAAILVDRLHRRGLGPVLAVDADPNRCLDAALGVTVGKTIGGIREEARHLARAGMAAGGATQELLDRAIAESLVEDEGFDLLAMGRPEGPGCYCHANHVLGEAIRRLAREYPYVVLDNEAGLENLSRRIVTALDLFAMVSDPSRQGFETVRRLHELACEMEIRYGSIAIVVNQAEEGVELECASAIGAAGVAPIWCVLPWDEAIAERSRRGERLRGLPDSNPVARGIDSLLDAVRLGTAMAVRPER